MMKTLSLCSLVAILAITGGSALAAPIVDGSVTGGDGYQFSLVDVAEPVADFFNTGLDIDTINFASDATYGYMGLTTVASPIDTDGDPTSLFGQTGFWAIFYTDATMTTPLYRLVVALGGAPMVNLAQWTGVWTPVALAPADYAVSAATDLELGISLTKMTLPPTFYFVSQLDGNGQWQDDQLAGTVPEPATLGLMAIGGVALAASRKRR
jgi:hypothetical protein